MSLRPKRLSLSSVKVRQVLSNKFYTQDAVETWESNIRQHVSHGYDDALQQKVNRFLGGRGASLESPKLTYKQHKERKENTRLLLQNSYAKHLYDRTMSISGVARIDLPKLISSFRRRCLRYDPKATLLRREKWIAQITKYTRQAKLFRIWFLDYHIMEILALIVERMERDLLGNVSRRSLTTELVNTRDTMRRITCTRHVEAITKERKKLFAIANTLRRLETEYINTQTETTKSQLLYFPSSQLRTAETKLLQAEVLSMELIVRKVLLNGPIIHRGTFTELRKLGYKPNSRALPMMELDID